MKYESFREKIEKVNFNDIGSIIRNAISFIIMTVVVIAIVKFVPLDQLDLNKIEVDSEDPFMSFYVKSFIIVFVIFYCLMYISIFVNLINSVLIFLENKSPDVYYPINNNSDNAEINIYDYMSKREKVINFLSMISSACGNAVFSVVGIFFFVIGIGIVKQNNQGMAGGIIVAIIGLVAAIAGLSPAYNSVMAYISQKTGKTFEPVGLKLVKRYLRSILNIIMSLAFAGVGVVIIVLGVVSVIDGEDMVILLVLGFFGLVFLIPGIILSKKVIPEEIEKIKYGSDD